jgi:YebC/PmpR family DNA-binding regulatory protein
MAGHSQFKNIMHRKGAQDAKRAKMFTKVVREIITAARSGLPDPAFNPRLRTAIALARSINMPKDKVEGAIKRGSSPAEGDNYEEMRYEGYANGGIAIIVEALTDNRNRTAADVRSLFTKYGGNLGETGSVIYMFSHVGLIQYPASACSADQILEYAIEAGADSCETDDDMHNITCAVDVLALVREVMAAKLGEPETCKLTWLPNTTTKVEGEQAEKIIKLVEALEDNDDVQYVYGNFAL